MVYKVFFKFCGWNDSLIYYLGDIDGVQGILQDESGVDPETISNSPSAMNVDIENLDQRVPPSIELC